MRHRKENLFSSHLQGEILCNYALLAISLFLLISCGGTAPSKQHISHPVPSPALFVLSSQGDIDAYRADGTILWQTNADTNSESIPNAQEIHLLNSSQMISVALGTIRAHSSNSGPQERLELIQTQSRQRYCKVKSEIEEELKTKTEAAEELRLSRWEVMD